MKAESVTLTFTEEAIREIARIAYEVCLHSSLLIDFVC
jgi:ATP-dependent protease HslVU (ClpYQ) ATPase subunit